MSQGLRAAGQVLAGMTAGHTTLARCLPPRTKGTSMRVTSETRLADGIVERDFLLGEIPGIVWMPASEASRSPAPLILMGHPGGLGGMRTRLVARARSAAAQGFASATIELPGSGERPASASAEGARAELRASIAEGRRPSEQVIDRLILPLVDHAVPEWQTALDALLALPGLGGPVGYSGGVIAIGTRLARVEPRIVAAGLFAGSFVPRATLDDAREVSIPLHVLLQWDDEGNDRQQALNLFDAFGSQEKSLYANLGGHTGVPGFAGEEAARFFVRHLAPDGASRRDHAQ